MIMTIRKPTILGFKHLFRRPVTIQYPFEKFKVGPNYRGVPALDFDLCTSCGRCTEVCPNKCTIMVEYNGKSVPNLYASRCMFCYLCVEVCPTGARVNTPVYELAEYSREATLFTPEQLIPLVTPELKTDTLPKAPVVDLELCVDCFMCKKVCPNEAISNIDEGTHRQIIIDYDTCTFCGKCIDICPPKALHYEQKEIKKGDKFIWEKEIPLKDIEVENYYQLLDKKVIEPHWCSHCTACVVACPVNRILGGDQEISEDLDIPCLDCSLCVRSCPRYDYENNKGMGEYTDVFSARSKRFVGQDGGMVTEMLVSAMEMGLIDTAIVVGSDDEWRPYLKIARNPDEITAGLKTKYALADILSALKAADKIAKKGIGIVGVPCQIEGFRQHAEHTKFFTTKVRLAIGILCTENFYYKRFYKELIEDEYGIAPKDLKRTDMKKGLLTIESKSGEVHKIKLQAIEHYALMGCHICQNFINMTADISVGGSGSSPGFSSMFVRNETAQKVIDYMVEKDTFERASEEKTPAVLKTCGFMVKYKAKLHPIEPYLKDRGIVVEKDESTEEKSG
ncbi:NADH-quinone oxidoreductase subunit I [archaeon BMS3Abin16]|nr:NADH-quinone oxidoreductase subunit I [archaeon BMS3Abin16]HDY74281.1 4Fe-4S dicluster domain-containing protein [Euryarchaeota archaeon]